MGANGVFNDPYPLGYLVVPEAVGHQHQQLQFSPCQRPSRSFAMGDFHRVDDGILYDVGIIEKFVQPVEQGRCGVQYSSYIS